MAGSSKKKIIMSKDTDVIMLRPVSRDDAKLLFKWRNDPIIIEYSTLKKTVEWDEHMTWFNYCYDNPSACRLFIIMCRETEIGTIRFERENIYQAKISVYFVPNYIGKGHGTTVIRQGVSLIADLWPDLKTIAADILERNTRALTAFRNAGFGNNTQTLLKNHKRLVYCY